MRTFTCVCQARLFFDNTRCLSCSRALGFRPDTLELIAIGEPSASPADDAPFRRCANYVENGICNWLVPQDSPEPLCAACRLNHTIPNLSEDGNLKLWREVESAKRRLIYGLYRLGLDVLSKTDDPVRGLAFDIKADVGDERVLTGHDHGLITLNLAEADPAYREQTRVALQERYRTLLGHFRHEIGHYYWERLVSEAGRLEPFRELFGDERQSYAEALEKHYQKPSGAPGPGFISAYAAAHPWEDFAETFAHYLHLRDTLETAEWFGVLGKAPSGKPELSQLLQRWSDVSVALNALNRSMGLPDAYPFAVTPDVEPKLEFVHRLVTNREADQRRAVA
jgi:hypothetical protein